MRCQFFLFLEIIQGSLLHFWGLQAFEALSCCPLTSAIAHQQKRDGICSCSAQQWAVLQQQQLQAVGRQQERGELLSSSLSASPASLAAAPARKLPGNGARLSLGLPPALLCCRPGLIPAGGWAQPGVGSPGFQGDGHGPGCASSSRGQKITWPQDKAPLSLHPLLGKLCHLLPDVQIFQFPEPSLPTKTSTSPCRE